MKTLKLSHTEITINHEQELFVIPCGKNGFTCLGFDVCKERSITLQNELHIIQNLPPKNSLRAYEYYNELCDTVRVMNTQSGFRSQTELYKPFIGNEGRRVEVVYSDGTKERFNIGKSTGYIPCHIMVKTSRSLGGGAVLTDSIKNFTFLS